jgi:RimJ/RimL family protein N-acetyltransferase
MLMKQNLRRYKTEFRHARPWFKTRSGITLRVRLLRRDDVDRMIEMFDRLSPESRRRRFHTGVEHVSRELIRQHAVELANVDNQLQGAVIATYEDEDGEHIVGVVRLARPAGQPTFPEAEAAIVIRDDFHGQGVGTELMRWMVLLAKEMKVKVIVATFHADNENAIRLFRELNLPSSLSIHHGETEMKIQVPS